MTTTSTRRARATTRTTAPGSMMLVRHNGAGSADIMGWHFVETPNQSFAQIISIDYAVGGDYAGMAPNVWYTSGSRSADEALMLDQSAARQSMPQLTTRDEGSLVASWADAIMHAARHTDMAAVPALTTRRVRAMARMMQRDGSPTRDTVRMTQTRVRGTSAYVGLTIDGLTLPFAVAPVDVPAHVLHAFFGTAGSVPVWGVTDELPHWLSSKRGRYLIGMRAARHTDQHAGRTVVMTALDVPRYDSQWHAAPSAQHLLDSRCGVDVVEADAAGLRAETTVAALLDYCEHDEENTTRQRAKRSRAGAAASVMFGMAIAAYGAAPRVVSVAPEHGNRRAAPGDTLRVAFNPRLLRDIISTYPSTTAVVFRTVARPDTRSSVVMPLAIDIGDDAWGVIMPLTHHHTSIDAGRRNASWETNT